MVSRDRSTGKLCHASGGRKPPDCGALSGGLRPPLAVVSGALRSKLMAEEKPPPPKPLDRRWRSGEPQSPGKARPRSAKRGQIIAGLVVILLLVGAVASLLLFIHP